MTNTEKLHIAKSILKDWGIDHDGGTDPMVTFELAGVRVRVEFEGGVEWQPEDRDVGDSEGYACHGGKVVSASVSFDWSSHWFPVVAIDKNVTDLDPFVLAAELHIEAQPSPKSLVETEE